MANEILNIIEREYDRTRQKNRDILESTLRKARENSEFAQAEKNIKSLNFAIAKAEKFDGDIALANELKAEREEQKCRFSHVLASLNLTPDDLKLKYDCPDCEDTGIIGAKPCRCFKIKYKHHTLSALGISPVPNITFENDTALKPEKLSKTYGQMKKYVQKFPDVKTHNFVFCGKTGSGKTFLASAMCGELDRRGFNCVFLTATELNQMFLKLHTTKLSDRPDYMSLLLSCDFLVIDDLGTENMYNNVTAEYLLTLISERLAKGRHTVVTTNLTQNEIMVRYNERLFSRLTEKRSSALIIFDDVNFRTQKT